MQLRCTGLADVEFAEDAARPGAVYDAVTAEAEAMTKESELVIANPLWERRWRYRAFQLMKTRGLAVKLDKNFSYAVLVSYSEVYNEKASREMRNAYTQEVLTNSLGRFSTFSMLAFLVPRQPSGIKAELDMQRQVSTERPPHSVYQAHPAHQ